MRDRESIEKEMFNVREDLERSLAELRHLLAEKVAVKARAQKAIQDRTREVASRAKEGAKDFAIRTRDGAKDLAARGRDQVHDLAVRTRHGAAEIYHRARDAARQRPVLLGFVLGAFMAATVAAVVVARRRRRRASWLDRLTSP